MNNNTTKNVTALPFRRPVITELSEQIKVLVYSYAGRISIAEAIGILEVVKLQIIEGAE